MRPQAQLTNPIIPGFHLHLTDILVRTAYETPVERDRPTTSRPIAARPCDGCGDPDPAVDLWAEHSETGEQLWLCLACGE